MVIVGINCAPLAARLSGVGRYIACLTQELGSQREELVFQPLGVPPSSRFKALSAARWLRPLAKSMPGAYEVIQAARSLRLRGLDLYHETNHVPPRFSGPTVVTVHDLSVLLHPRLQEKARTRYFSRELPRRLPRAARVIVPTEAVRREVVELLKLDPSRVVAIPHGVEPQFKPPSEAQRAMLKGAFHRPYFLYVGNLEPRKNLPRLIEAYRMLPAAIQREHALVLIGDPERLDASIRAELEKARRGPGEVVITGYLGEEGLPGAYQAAKLFVYPSLYEGFGLPVIEAMACGTPVVASTAAAVAEVAGDAGLLAPPEDAEALARNMARLVEDSSLAAEYTKKGLERARQFTWERSARLHVDAYREALASVRAPRAVTPGSTSARTAR